MNARGAALLSALLCACARDPAELLLRITLLDRGAGQVTASLPPRRCPPDCDLQVPAGALTELSAVPLRQATFLGWSGACAGAAPTCQLALTAPSEVVAQFAAPVALQVSVSGSGWVRSQPAGLSCPPTCRAEFPIGQPVALTAQADAGALFAGFGAPCADAARCLVVPGETAQVEARFERALCTPTGFCWEHPLPQGRALRALWGTSRRDLWAVGEQATLLHWDGEAFTAHPSLSGLAPPLLAVWGAGTSEVFAAGASGLVLRFDGARWLRSESGTRETLYALWGSSSQDLWAAGGYGTGVLLHFDGNLWQTVPAPGARRGLRALWGSSATDVWVAGDEGVFQRSGAAWLRHPAAPEFVIALWGSGPQDLWALTRSEVFRFDGARWTRVLSGGTSLTGIWGSSARDVWVTAADALWHFDGRGFAALPTPEALPVGPIWGDAADGVWAASDNVLLRWDGATWRRLGARSSGDILGVWGTEAQGFAVGAATLRYDGGAWRAIPAPGGLAAVWVGADGEGWAVGSSIVRLHQGRAFPQEQPPPSPLRGLFALSPRALFAVGEKGTLLSSDGLTMTAQASGTSSDLNAVWAASSQDLWTVGNFGLVRRWNGSRWEALPVPEQPRWAELRGIWGASPEEVYIVGTLGVLRWDGARLTREPLSLGGLAAIGGTSRQDVWVAGSSSSVAHFDGATWQVLDPGLFVNFRALWAVARGHALFAGQDGTLLRYRRAP